MPVHKSRIISRSLFIFLYCIFLQIGNVNSQNQWIAPPDGQRMELPNSGPYSYSLEMEGSQANSLTIDDPSELIKVIVVFKEPPLTQLMNNIM